MKRVIKVGDVIQYKYDGNKRYWIVLRLLPDDPPVRYPFAAKLEYGDNDEVTLFDNGDFVIMSSLYGDFLERIKDRMG